MEPPMAVDRVDETNSSCGSGGSDGCGSYPKFSDLGGISKIIEKIQVELFLLTSRNKELPVKRRMTGLLLHGPMGCGKTMLASAIANELKIPFFAFSGDAHRESLSTLFERARQNLPSVVLIEHLDAIDSKSKAQLMYQFYQFDEEPILVVGETNILNQVDRELRKPGRFDLEVEMGVLGVTAREEILSVISKKVRGSTLDGDIDLKKIAKTTPGFVGADLSGLVRQAVNLATKRMFDKREDRSNLQLWRQPLTEAELNSIRITMADFEIMKARFRAAFLLFGPPGCGKTLIAAGIANEAGANFIHIKDVDESELEARKLFERARTHFPCIIFFDHVETLNRRIIEELKQLLIELDRANGYQGVFVIGATDRIELMEPELLWSTRFENILYVPLPDADERMEIMKIHLKNKLPLDADVDLHALARKEQCNNLSGADLAALVDEAGLIALGETQGLSPSECPIKASHFELASSKITPSVNAEQREYYEATSIKYKARSVKG